MTDSPVELEEEIEAWGGDAKEWELEPDDCQVHPDNWSALNAFLRIDHCWHLSASGKRQRLAWQDVNLIWEGLGISLDKKDFERVSILERMLIEV